MNKYDYSKLNGRIREKGYTQETLAQKMSEKTKLSVCSLNLTLNNKRDFKQEEIFQICEILDIPVSHIPKYFFCHKALEI